MEVSECSCSAPPILGSSVFPKNPATSEELEDIKKPLSPIRPKTPTSPEPNCAICLGKLQNTSFTDSCLHQFCFTCLLEWSKVKPECPLCKQTFKSIIHNIRSIEDYDQYHLYPTQAEHHLWTAVDMELHRRHSLIAGLWRPSPILQDRATLRGLLPGDDAVIPSMSRVPIFRIREVVSAEFRRSVYERNIWAEPLYDVTGRFRECTAEFFRQNEAAVHRLIPWLNRELDAILWNGVNKSHVLELILNMLPRYNICSSEFRSQLAPYLRGYVTHFLHEFYNFARSPYDMIGFDRSVHYSNAVQPFLVLSSDESDGDIMVLSSPARSATASPELVSVLVNVNANAAAGSSRQAAGSQQPVDVPAPRRTVERDGAVNSDSTVDLDENDADSDCMIVGFVKPRHERSPQVITLASDEECRPPAENIPKVAPRNYDLSTSSESSCTSQTSDSDYSPSKSRSVCKKRKKMRKVRKDTKVAVKEKPKKSYRHTTHRSRKSTSSSSKTKKLKKIKELFSSSSSLSSSSSSSSDEELRSKRRIQRDKKLTHTKGVWHVKMRGTLYDDEDERLRDHNYMMNHNPPYTKEEIDEMQGARNPPKLKSIVIARMFPDNSPSVSGSSGSSSHYQSHASSSKHSHGHRSSHKRSKHDKKRSEHDKKRSEHSERRRSKYSSSDASACKVKSRKLSDFSSDSDDSS